MAPDPLGAGAHKAYPANYDHSDDLVPVDLPDMLEEWRTEIALLDAFRQELRDAEDVPRLAYGLDRIRELRKALGDLEREVETDVYDLMEGKTHTVDGLGTLEARGATVRKQWESTALLRHLVRQALDPDGTGVLPDAATVLDEVMATVTECMPVTPSLGWRVTALKARGVYPDDWCESRPGRTSIQIHKADP